MPLLSTFDTLRILSDLISQHQMDTVHHAAQDDDSLNE